MELALLDFLLLVVMEQHFKQRKHAFDLLHHFLVLFHVFEQRLDVVLVALQNAQLTLLLQSAVPLGFLLLGVRPGLSIAQLCKLVLDISLEDLLKTIGACLLVRQLAQFLNREERFVLLEEVSKELLGFCQLYWLVLRKDGKAMLLFGLLRLR